MQQGYTLTLDRAQQVADHNSLLDLDEYESLDEAAAEVLASLGCYLTLNGLKHLTDLAAVSLSRHRGSLQLNGLTSLSDTAAESLSQHNGGIYLEGLIQISETAAQSMSKHQSWIELGWGLPRSMTKIIQGCSPTELQVNNVVPTEPTWFAANCGIILKKSDASSKSGRLQMIQLCELNSQSVDTIFGSAQRGRDNVRSGSRLTF